LCVIVGISRPMLAKIFEILTIGLPFSAFKILTGMFLDQYWLILLGAVDLLINMTNLISLFLIKKRVIDSCFLSFLVCAIKKPSDDMQLKWQDLGNALDVLLSFILVAYMIGGGFIGLIAPVHLAIWNISVVLNVVGAGLGRLSGSILNIRTHE
jgi:hypothetical protein